MHYTHQEIFPSNNISMRDINKDLDSLNNSI